MKPQEFTQLLLEKKFNFITGVPDSLFKDAIIDINNNKNFQHIISNNEGEACAIASGFYLGTNKIPVVYMQNSGLGNCINPLTSLLDHYIYSIPALLLITWRGQPGKKDEPQHQRMGEILPQLLNLLKIPFHIASPNVSEMEKILSLSKEHLEQYKYPCAILFPNDVIESLSLEKKTAPLAGIFREDVLKNIVENSNKNDVILTTTGKTSRELFEIRETLNKEHHQDFLTVGSMGCVAAIAFGISCGQPQRRIIVIDGDGACLMRLETLSLIGHYKPPQLLHIIINNNAYESTGSQKTLAETTNFVNIAKDCEYKFSISVKNLDTLKNELLNFKEGPKLIDMKVNTYSRSNLSRPSTTPLHNKEIFMNFLNKSAQGAL